MFQQKMTAQEKKKADKPAIVVENLTKEFNIPHERRTTLFENLKGAFQPSAYERFVALKNVTFAVEKGESIGVIGDNGSGKSTLLKLLAQIIRPTSGRITVNGKITPFLELGVGFQPDMTARENIEVYGTVMGLSNKEIFRNMDSVLEFAGLTKFRDTKLKNFSSGMAVRLAFSTAIQVKPEILLVDEVLAVGDMEFQQKCLDIFNEYIQSDVTILFVSHDLTAVRRFCSKTILMDHGKMAAFGKTSEIIDRYVYKIDSPVKTQADHPATHDSATHGEPGIISNLQMEHAGNQRIVINSVKITDKYGRANNLVNSGDPIKIELSYVVQEPTFDPIFGIAIYDESGSLCYGINTEIQGLNLGLVSGSGSMEIIFQNMALLSGKYWVTIAVHSKDNTNYDWLDKIVSFNIVNTSRVAGSFDLKGKWGEVNRSIT